MPTDVSDYQALLALAEQQWHEQGYIEWRGFCFEPCRDPDRLQWIVAKLRIDFEEAKQHWETRMWGTREWVSSGWLAHKAGELYLSKARKPWFGHWSEIDWAIFNASHGIPHTWPPKTIQKLT